MHEISPTTRVLQAYGGRVIPTMGTCNLLCKAGKVERAMELFIIATEVTQIIGYRLCLAFGLVSISSVTNVGLVTTDSSTQEGTLPESLSRYAAVFSGVGIMDGLVHIHMRPEVQPIVRPARRTLFPVEPKVNAELKRMLELGVIRRVTKPTRLVNET